MFRTNHKLLAVAFAIIGSTCYAHEGHGHSSLPGNSASHYFTEPLHLAQFAGIALVVLLVGGAALRVLISRYRNQLPTNHCPPD